ncbi:hypothetical protein J3Q64DRAFT_1697921 [Phycomyces blakesleeanus]|uniref:Uncharacterized protein n=2 Tax=Phycomyces blakesleeanus TaxID=4837 RepID=A0A167LNS8_PHYB8|nr:hypothetical protein PHYBLDRAFT_64115 [Phycomyces blakesleeanus NRRL 1555(-)]OAD70809.1 hypothetical protein PHYBLDRAFT_64115 [Phycomyces blakesleeanus NRRL 1555(-)]|eukprot:XP_018288849.1 hypothetical protein PHYBLDRAFT_64115 [Phycomyces blakesleeanus NRRL 1555(-)]
MLETDLQNHSEKRKNSRLFNRLCYCRFKGQYIDFSFHTKKKASVIRAICCLFGVLCVVYGIKNYEGKCVSNSVDATDDRVDGFPLLVPDVAFAWVLFPRSFYKSDTCFTVRTKLVS